jgi:hypothetical protein
VVDRSARRGRLEGVRFRWLGGGWTRRETWMRLNGHSWRAVFDRAGHLFGAIGLGEDVYLREFGRAVGYLIWICQDLCHIWLLLVEIDAQLDITPRIDIYFCQ